MTAGVNFFGGSQAAVFYDDGAAPGGNNAGLRVCVCV